MRFSRAAGTLTLVGEEAVFYADGSDEVHLLKPAVLAVYQACNHVDLPALEELAGPDAEVYLAELIGIGAIEVTEATEHSRRKLLEIMGKAAVAPVVSTPHPAEGSRRHLAPASSDQC